MHSRNISIHAENPTGESRYEMNCTFAAAHLWFVTLHPFEDGNGRVTRALTDRALAQAEQSSIRFYSHNAAIMARCNEYYTILEQTQKGSLDITAWLQCFLSILNDALNQGLARFQRIIEKLDSGIDTVKKC